VGFAKRQTKLPNKCKYSLSTFPIAREKIKSWTNAFFAQNDKLVNQPLRVMSLIKSSLIGQIRINSCVPNE
jgi:hypothetical protein